MENNCPSVINWESEFVEVVAAAESTILLPDPDTSSLSHPGIFHSSPFCP